MFDEYKNDKEEELTDLEKKLAESHKEEYEGWLNNPITQEIRESLLSDIEEIKKRMEKVCLSSLDKEVDSKKIQTYALQIRALERVLKCFKIKSTS